jgi:hypothetical protein
MSTTIIQLRRILYKKIVNYSQKRPLFFTKTGKLARRYTLCSSIFSLSDVFSPKARSTFACIKKAVYPTQSKQLFVFILMFLGIASTFFSVGCFYVDIPYVSAFLWERSTTVSTCTVCAN